MPKKPSISDRIELELHMSHDPPNQYIMQVWLDGECLLTIWCDHIGVYPTTKPPVFTLSMHGEEVSSLSGKVLRIRWDAAKVIPEASIAMLGKYVEVMPEPQPKTRKRR